MLKRGFAYLPVLTILLISVKSRNIYKGENLTLNIYTKPMRSNHKEPEYNDNSSNRTIVLPLDISNAGNEYVQQEENLNKNSNNVIKITPIVAAARKNASSIVKRDSTQNKAAKVVTRKPFPLKWWNAQKLMNMIMWRQTLLKIQHAAEIIKMRHRFLKACPKCLCGGDRNYRMALAQPKLWASKVFFFSFFFKPLKN